MSIEHFVTAKIVCRRKFPAGIMGWRYQHSGIPNASADLEAAAACRVERKYEGPRGQAAEGSFEDRAAAHFRDQGWIVGDKETTRCPSCARYDAGEKPGPVVKFLG